MTEDIGTVKVDLKDTMRRVTFRVEMKHEKQLKIRLKIAAWLIRLAAWIAWANIEFIAPGEIR